MADKLVVLTVLLVFSSFGPIISGRVSDQELADSGDNNDLSPAFEPGSYFQNAVENSASSKGAERSIKQSLQYHQDVEEEQRASDRNSGDDSEDKAPSSETAESEGSPGFFSQMLSELAAPLYEEDEQDFLSEDREPENPSVEDEVRDDDPEDAIDETSNGEDNQPNFASSRFEKSVTENVNSARTVDKETYFGGATESDAHQGKGKDQPFPNVSMEGNVLDSLLHLSTLDLAEVKNKNPELPDVHAGEPDVEINSKLEEGSVDLNKVQSEQDSAVNTESESSVEQVNDIDIDSQGEKEQSNSNKMQSEQDSTVNSVNDEDSNTESSGREEPAEKEAEIDSGGENRGRQDPEQEEPRSAGSSGGTRFDKKQPHYENGTTELSDEELEHLRVKSKPSLEQIPSDALEEDEQDLRKNKKEEAVKSRLSQEQIPSDALEEEEQDLRKNRKEEAEEQEAKERSKEQARKFRLEKAKRDAEEKEKVLEEQARNLLSLEKEKRDAEKKKATEEQARKLVLEKEKRDAEKKKVIEEQARKVVLEKEKRIAEEKKKAMEEQARKVRLEKEKMAAEVEKIRKEEEARQLRLESLKKQRQQIEETEKRLRREEEEKGLPLKKLLISGMERIEEEVDDKVPEDKGIDQEKENPTQDKEETSEDSEDEEHMKIKGAFDRKMAEEEAALKRRLEILSEERRNFEKLAEEYRVSKKERQQKEQEEKLSTKDSAESELSKAATAVSPSPKQDKTSQDQAATQTVNSSATTTTAPAVNEELAATQTNTKTEATLVKPLQGMPTKVKESVGSRTKRAKAVVTATTMATVKEEGLSSVDVKASEATDPGVEKEHVDKGKEDKIPSDKATCIEGFCQAKPNVISLASRFQKVEDSLTSKVVLGQTQFNNLKENNDSLVNETLSGYATFMRAFRNFHEKSVLFVLSYWPVAKNTTRDLLAYVGLDGMFEQLCNDLADVHPAVLFVTFLFGTLGFLYFFWSLTFGRMRHGAQGPNPHDVLRSYEARVRILEEEVKSVEADKLKADIERNASYKEKLISDEQLQNAKEMVLKLTKQVDKCQKEKQDIELLVKEMQNNCQKLATKSKEKSEEITGCENMISDLRAKIEAKEGEIQKLNDDFQKQQMEKEASEKHIEELNEKIQQADVENEKLEHLLTETKEKKQNLQVEFDDQLLRLTELQQQYEFRCNEVEVLKDCLKQIKLHGDGEEEPDEDEMAGRLQNLMNVDEIKTENKALQEKVARLETEAEELRRIRKMLENDNVEKTERLEQAESKASQAMLTQREKEIELEALQKYFKSTEVELHRKITAEESSRISIENQLQSEQAKASTAVVDADKYRQLYLDIKKQIEEIDESKKEQLSNMEKKAHQNWLDYRAAVRELDGLKDENEILRRKLYDLEVRGSRPGSSASSQLNHVDGRDSPSRRSPMSGPPGHGSPVPFNAPPMMGPPPPLPPSSMFPGQRRPHPADMLGMTPPRPPFPSPGPVSRGHATPPPITSAATAQASKTDDRPDSFVQDSKDGAPPPPPPPMSGYGPPPLPPIMRMPMFPPRPMMPPPPSGPHPRMFLPRPGGPMPPPPPQGPRPQASSTPNRS